MAKTYDKETAWTQYITVEFKLMNTFDNAIDSIKKLEAKKRELEHENQS